MVSTVRSRPNHYEALGLTPAASDEDIRRAFVGKMSVFGTHPIAEAGQILVAYETLRDSTRRKAYDDSLGLNAKPEAREWSFSVTPPRWAPFIASIPEQTPSVAERPPEPHVAPEAAPALRSSPQGQRPRQPEPEVDLDAVIQRVRAMGRAEKERLRRAQSESPDWKRVGLALGGLVIAAGLIGTLAGVSVKDNVDSAQAAPTEAVRRPAAGPADAMAAPSPTPLADPTEARFDPPVRTAAAESRAARSASRHGRWAEQMGQSFSSETGPTDGSGGESAAAQPAADPQSAQAAAADLPLSNSVVARTIDRIGYACGQVASAAAVEGAPGVYKITCSSGQTYRAARVGGRYHFRRLGGR